MIQKPKEIAEILMEPGEGYRESIGREMGLADQDPGLGTPG